MNDSRIRIWVEEIEPPSVLRFSWERTEKSSPAHCDDIRVIVETLERLEGVSRAEAEDEGVRVLVDTDQITRYAIAEAMREVLEPMPEQTQDPPNIRVWAEDLGPSRLQITWSEEETDMDETAMAVRRRVAAFLLVTKGIKAATPHRDGVDVEYEAAELERSSLREVVVTAVRFNIPLRQRGDELLKRATTYGNLARKLALDGRISPLPDAAKQAAASQAGSRGGGGMAARSVLRFIPGATLITRIQTLIPVLMELSKWSRDADPEIVSTHLDSVGLDRATLKRDTITAQEIRLYARDAASETAASLSRKASEGAQQALTAGRDIWSSVRAAASQGEQDAKDDSSPDSDQTPT